MIVRFTEEQRAAVFFTILRKNHKESARRAWEASGAAKEFFSAEGTGVDFDDLWENSNSLRVAMYGIARREAAKKHQNPSPDIFSGALLEEVPWSDIAMFHPTKEN